MFYYVIVWNANGGNAKVDGADSDEAYDCSAYVGIYNSGIAYYDSSINGCAYGKEAYISYTIYSIFSILNDYKILVLFTV